MLAIAGIALLAYYALLNFARLEIFKLLLRSFFPLTLLILAVLGSIITAAAAPSRCT